MFYNINMKIFDKLIKGQEVKKEVNDEPKSDDDDEDVDGVPMEDGEDKVAETAKFRHPAIPGGLLEPEQRNTGIDEKIITKNRF